MIKIRFIAALFGGVTALALTAATAQPFLLDEEEETEEEETSLRGSFWNFGSNVTWSDNYRRLPGLLARFDVTGPEEGDVTAQEVGVEPIDNVIYSAALNGATFVRSKELTGFLAGTIRIGGYGDGTNDNEKLLEGNVPPPTYPNVPNADGNFTTFGLAEPDEFFIVPDILGAATFELSEGRWYLDVSGLAQESSFGRPSVINRRGSAAGLDTMTYVGGTVSPYLHREYGDQQMLEMRARASGIFVANERAGLGDEIPGFTSVAEDGQFANDSFAGEFSTDYSTGSQFEDISYGFSGYVRHVTETGSETLPSLYVTELTARADGTYALNDKAYLLGAVGYDDITLNINDGDEEGERRFERDLNGAYWNIGLRYAPTRKALAEIVAGQRYGGPSLEGRVNMVLTPRITFTANALKTFDTGGQRHGRSIGGLQSRNQTILTRLSEAQGEFSTRFLRDLVDQDLLGSGLDEEFRSGAFVFKQFSASLTALLSRNQFGITAGYSEAEAGEIDNEAFNFTAYARRRLNRRLSVNASYTYGESEGVGVVTDLLGNELGVGERSSSEQFIRAGANYEINRRLSATISTYYGKNEQDGDAASRGPGFNFEETAIIFGLNWAL